MKVVAFNASPRTGGNTEFLLKKALEPLEAGGVETELIQIGGKPVHGCKACYACQKAKNGRCVIEDDFINDCIAKCVEADGILLGSPTYFADVSTEMKAFIDRVGFVCKSQGLLTRKLGAAVIAVRRAGAVHVLDTINHFFLINGMYIVGGTYWNMGFGLKQGEVAEDEEGIRNMTAVGENMLWMLQKINNK